MLLFYSHNSGKIAEVTSILQAHNIECLSALDANITTGCPETGATFVENAILKARDGARQSGHACLADDSGLVVDALSGEPGVMSGRYAGDLASDQENMNLLITRLDATNSPNRNARFICCMVYLRHAQDPYPIVTHGTLEGVTATKPSGKSGFGYDPIFQLPNINKTLAHLSPAEKNKISHRGQACRKMCHLLSVGIPD